VRAIRTLGDERSESSNSENPPELLHGRPLERRFVDDGLGGVNRVAEVVVGVAVERERDAAGLRDGERDVEHVVVDADGRVQGLVLAGFQRAVAECAELDVADDVVDLLGVVLLVRPLAPEDVTDAVLVVVADADETAREFRL